MTPVAQTRTNMAFQSYEGVKLISKICQVYEIKIKIFIECFNSPSSHMTS